MSELAKLTGLTVPHLCMLRKRGILPWGRKEGKIVYLPRFESELALLGRKQRGPNKRVIEFENGSTMVIGPSDATMRGDSVHKPLSIEDLI